MDYLDSLIQLSQIEGKIDALCRFQGNWKIHQQKTGSVGVFHIVSKGQCYIQLKGQEIKLTEGDVIFLPNGESHCLTSAFETSLPLNEVIRSQQIASFDLYTSGYFLADFEMFCGYFRYTHQGNIPLFYLPEWFLSHHNQSVMAILQLLKQEIALNLGNQTAINALCNILFIYLIRDFIEKQNLDSGIIAALKDKRLQQAVNAMLSQPEMDWNMDTLAKLCSMSRANFMRLFKEKTGILVGKFLTELRLQKAANYLKNNQQTIQQIAFSVGYSSESHFCKLFKKRYQCSPSQFRQQQQKMQ